MKKKNTLKVILIVGVLVILGVILARWLMKNKNSTDSDSTVSGGSTDSGTNTTNADFPLRRGSRGKQVTQLQRWLNTNTSGLIYDTASGLLYVSPHKAVGVDSIFGAETERELKAATGMTEVSKDYFTKTHMNSL